MAIINGMSSPIHDLQTKYGQMMAECARAHRRIDELQADMRQLARYRGEQQSETSFSWRPMGISVKFKNVAPWVLVFLMALAALIVAIVKR